jgi:hypothetical protein
MPSIDEKRVYGTTTGATRLLVASGVGVVRVAVSDDIVGEFGIDHACVAADLAAGEDGFAVATDEDVLVGDYEPTGHGPATAVGVETASDGTRVVAAAPDGTVARLPADATDWLELGAVTGPRAADGALLATDDGVVRATEDGLEPVGLDGVRDVVARPVPYAATENGLYRLGNGWQRLRDGAFTAVATGASDEAVVAADSEAVYSRGVWADGGTGAEWTRHDQPGVVAVTVADDTVAGVTDDGTVRVTVGDGWRSRALGVTGVESVVTLV